MKMKRKMATAGIACGLLFGGAVAGASSESFSSFLNGATNTLFEKVANLAGYQVYRHGETAKADVESHVEAQANRAGGAVGGHYVTETNRGTGEVTSHKNALKNEITAAVAAEEADAKSRITEAVNEEVTLTNSELDAAAQAKAQSLLDALNGSITMPRDGRQ